MVQRRYVTRRGTLAPGRARIQGWTAVGLFTRLNHSRQCSVWLFKVLGVYLREIARKTPFELGPSHTHTLPKTNLFLWTNPAKCRYHPAEVMVARPIDASGAGSRSTTTEYHNVRMLLNCLLNQHRNDVIDIINEGIRRCFLQFVCDNV